MDARLTLVQRRHLRCRLCPRSSVSSNWSSLSPLATAAMHMSLYGVSLLCGSRVEACLAWAPATLQGWRLVTAQSERPTHGRPAADMQRPRPTDRPSSASSSAGQADGCANSCQSGGQSKGPGLSRRIKWSRQTVLVHNYPATGRNRSCVAVTKGSRERPCTIPRVGVATASKKRATHTSVMRPTRLALCVVVWLGSSRARRPNGRWRCSTSAESTAGCLRRGRLDGYSGRVPPARCLQRGGNRLLFLRSLLLRRPVHVRHCDQHGRRAISPRRRSPNQEGEPANNGSAGH